MHASSQWEDLPSDLLVSILRRLDFGSIICCMVICKSWNHAITQNCRALLSACKDQDFKLLYDISLLIGCITTTSPYGLMMDFAWDHAMVGFLL
jgi:F-box domain